MPSILDTSRRPGRAARRPQVDEGRDHVMALDLVHAVQHLSLARDLEGVQHIVKGAARRLVGADGATFVLRDGDSCHYVDEDAVSPLWKGRRFPMDSCISGWAMQRRRAAVIPDIYVDERIPHDAYRPTFVNSLVTVPIRTTDPIGAIGVYWADHHEATPTEVQALQALADSTAMALESIRLWEDLEARVADRTAELAATARRLEDANAQLAQANRRLADEVADRQRAEERVRLLSMTDELTGLRNRRGFARLAGTVLDGVGDRGTAAKLVFVDVDGLKEVNDDLGHEHGDRLLLAAADVLRDCFRDEDTLARLGGDEFAVLVPHAPADDAALVARVETAAATASVDLGLPAPLRLSVGVATPGPGDTLDRLLSRADTAMYLHKQAKRTPPQAG